MSSGYDLASRRVYEAEAEALRIVPIRRFSRFAQIETYVQTLVLGQWWSEQFPTAPLEVHLERRSSGATYSAAHLPSHDVGVIHLVDGSGWGLETVLHELAHVAAGVGDGHGARFQGGAARSLAPGGRNRGLGSPSGSSGTRQHRLRTLSRDVCCGAEAPRGTSGAPRPARHP
ncbi:MAG: hypothetical protein R2789_03820 [Microthrixaceae bacterium]